MILEGRLPSATEKYNGQAVIEDCLPIFVFAVEPDLVLIFYTNKKKQHHLFFYHSGVAPLPQI